MKEFKINGKTIILSVAYLIINFILYIYLFNMSFLRKYPAIYEALKRNTSISLLGNFALAGKQMNYKGQIINILDSAYVKQAKASAIIFLLIINLIIFVLWFCQMGRNRGNRF